MVENAIADPETRLPSIEGCYCGIETMVIARSMQRKMQITILPRLCSCSLCFLAGKASRSIGRMEKCADVDSDGRSKGVLVTERSL